MHQLYAEKQSLGLSLPNKESIDEMSFQKKNIFIYFLITHSSVLSSVVQTEEDSETEADSDPRHYLAS